MKGNFNRLWRETGNPGPAPGLNYRDIQKRVNAALDADAAERRSYMRHKLRVAVAAAAITAMLTGSAMAAASHWDVLNAFFGGDTSPAVELVNNEVQTIQDENYTLTVESSVSDGVCALVLVKLEARTAEAAAFMNSNDFNGIDTWSVRPLVEQTGENGETSLSPVGTTVGYSELKEQRTETAQTWCFDLDLQKVDCRNIRVRMGYMEPGLEIQVPLSPAQSVTVEIGAKGQGAGLLEYLEGGPIILNRVSLSPFTVQMEYTGLEDEPQWSTIPLVFFLGKDGTLSTMSQMLEYPIYSGKAYSCRFRSVQDLGQLEAVVFEGMAYPLDGGAAYPCQVDETLYPHQLPLMERTPEAGYGLPVQAMCDALGVEYQWDNDTQTATMTYRGVTIALTVDSTTALVDGQPVELRIAPHIQDGQLEADCQVFEDNWKVYLCAAYKDAETHKAGGQREAWLVIP